MAKICPVCNEKIGFFEIQPQPGFFTHPADCEAKFLQSPEIFGGKAIEKTEAQPEAKYNAKQIQNIKLKTAFSFSNYSIEDEIGIVTAECVFGMNIFIDFFAGMSDFFGGRSSASQKILRDARNNCLNELKQEVLGNLDEDTIFYLMSRGLNYQQSKKLLINGFLLDVVEKVTDLEIKNLIKNIMEIKE